MTRRYEMTISRLTVEKLGVKLYDRVSAVIAELVSNCYDADATRVVVTAPMGRYLASKQGEQVIDKGLAISVCDNGIGMTPEEINKFYLRVGAERRSEAGRGRGDKSPLFGRRVMGRKGVGKLSSFGICNIIEVLSSGGEKESRESENGSQEEGYLTAHLILNRNDILEDTDHAYRPEVGHLDGTLQPKTGTTITLKEFAYRKVSAPNVFARQLAQRFGIQSQDWSIMLRNSAAGDGANVPLEAFMVPSMDDTRIEFQGIDTLPTPELDSVDFPAIGPDGEKIDHLNAGFWHDERFYPVTGWTAYARNAYRDDLMAGIRIYCRGKIASQTPLFNRKAGFTGEHDVRSYLIGALDANWLDETEDLIQTDRRDILWSHELGQAFQEWGQRVVLEMGRRTRTPMRKKTRGLFLEIGRVQERIEETFPHPEQEELRRKAHELAGLLGRTIRADEVQDETVVEPLVQLTLDLAPHITLDEQLRQAGTYETPIGMLGQILRTARLAELASFGRIAEDRLKVIEKVEGLKNEPTTAEYQLQELLTYAPWLINPQWALIGANQTFRRLKRELEKFYKERNGEEISLSETDNPYKRPDFVLFNLESGLELIEIKRPGHSLKNDEMVRINTYHDTLVEFFENPAHGEFRKIFPDFSITLICDDLALSGVYRTAFSSFKENGKLHHIDWSIFLLQAEQVHRDFLEEAQNRKRHVTDTL